MSTHDPIKSQQKTFDLKWSLTIQVGLLVLLCLVVASAIITLHSVERAQYDNRSVAEAVGRQLDLQLLRIQSALDVPERFPDADAITQHVLRPGQCVRFEDASGSTKFSNCVGTDSLKAGAPNWFAQALIHWTSVTDETRRPVVQGSNSKGAVIVSSGSMATATQAWQEISPMLALSVGFASILCLLVYFVIARALRPTQIVVSGVEKLARGDLQVRMPSFRLTELNTIGKAFNTLAERLARMMSERSLLARQLVETQELERAHLARDLHDELAQNLSALSAASTSLKVKARKSSPEVLSDAENLAETAQSIMKDMRRVMNNLRPYEIEEIGLTESLNGLIDGFRAKYPSDVSVTRSISKDLDQFKPALSTHIYRIVQEGLNNVFKHARAKHVDVSIKINGGSVLIDIWNDGVKITNYSNQVKTGFGFGLRGIRERTLALGGSASYGANGISDGWVLSVALPAEDTMGTSR